MHGAKFFRFAPTKELGFVLLSYVAVIAMFYLSFQVITTRNVAGQFITFGILGITLLGIFVPAYWTLFIKRRTLASLGIKKDKLALSIILCIVLSFLQYWITLRTIELPSWQLLVPLMTMALAVGFFENVFFRGWMQLRFEECFGLIPAILLSAAFYSLYHIGYGMRIDEMSFLFLIGLIYSSIFRLTSSLFIVFPFLTPLGALFSQIKDGLVLPFEATYGFVDVIVLIVIGLIFLNRKAKKKNPIPQT